MEEIIYFGLSLCFLVCNVLVGKDIFRKLIFIPYKYCFNLHAFNYKLIENLCGTGPKKVLKVTKIRHI